jgi:hypothetical protein
MPETNAKAPLMARASRFIATAISRFIWLLVLAPILVLSAYSLYWVGRHFGVPPLIAITISTCFDGAALKSADYSLKYAQKGLSGTLPNTFTRILAITSAFLQTFHARLAGEPPGAWILWSSLPIIATILYEIHLRLERFKALARTGQVYPAPVPKWGIASWFLFPLATLSSFRDIVKARSEALKTAGLTVISDFQAEVSRLRNTRERIEPLPRPAPEREREADVAAPEVLERHRQRRTEDKAPGSRNAAPAHGSWAARHKPEIRMREWALQQSAFRARVGQRGRLPADIKEAYYQAFPEERPA